MKRILIATCLLIGTPLTATAAPAPCAAPAKNVADLYTLVAAKCSPITFDQGIAGQTLTVALSLPLASGVVLDGEGKNITLQGNGTINPLIKLASGNATVQNITLTNPGKTAVSIALPTSNNNKLSGTTINGSNIGVYVSGSGNTISFASFSGNTTAIQLNGSNNGIQPVVVTSYQVSATDETQWTIKGSTVNGQAIGGSVDLYLADPNSSAAQGKTYKASTVVAADGTFSFTLPYAGKGTETAPYTLLVTDLAGNTSAFSTMFTPESNPNFFSAVDPDGDGVFNSQDNCPVVKNFDQADFEKDGVGDACDNCDSTVYVDQADMDNDGVGDACDPDADGDGVVNLQDNCPITANVDQSDADLDGMGDACDQQTVTDADADSIPDIFDSCPYVKNADQADLDQDDSGDACDEDADADGVANLQDNCPYVVNVNQADTNGNGTGDLCETATGVIDSDGDGMPDTQDNCPYVKNPDQADQDTDATGDACDVDIDGDTVDNAKDNCPLTSNVNQANVDVDALGDACDAAATTTVTTSESPAAPASSNSGCSLVADGADRIPGIKVFLLSALLLAGILGLRLATPRRGSR